MLVLEILFFMKNGVWDKLDLLTHLVRVLRTFLRTFV